jgi:hypothetical protein
MYIVRIGDCWSVVATEMVSMIGVEEVIARRPARAARDWNCIAEMAG